MSCVNIALGPNDARRPPAYSSAWKSRYREAKELILNKARDMRYIPLYQTCMRERWNDTRPVGNLAMTMLQIKPVEALEELPALDHQHKRIVKQGRRKHASGWPEREKKDGKQDNDTTNGSVI